MALMFSAAPGTVVRVDQGRPAVPFNLRVEGFPLQRCIVTQIGIQAEGNHQFLHTAGDFIYLYVFGDRIAELTVSGIAFLGGCDGANSGFDSAFDYYLQNRIAARSTPVKILAGQKMFNGFLTGTQSGIQDPERMLGQFMFRFNSFSVE